MSKKKASAGATMSLKDFHGGSIPSDLPLPSAPGIMVRSGSDRNNTTNWGNNLLRPDHRSHPKSSGTSHNFDEKASFLSHPAPIGLNFDEDERKPLGGVIAPRRTMSEESHSFSSSINQEMNPDYAMSRRVITSVVPETSNFGTSLGPVRVAGSTSVRIDSQIPIGNNGQGVANSKGLGGNNGQGANNSHPNAWGLRREVMDFGERSALSPSSSLLSGHNAVLKFTQASAVEKVSSGMWQSKSLTQLPHILSSKDNNVANAGEETKKGGNDLLRRPNLHSEELQSGVNIGGSHLQPTTPLGILEHPKLNLFPRSKPLETGENRQGYQQPVDCGKVETVNELHGKPSSLKPELSVADSVAQTERPRLNLKPRSQPLEQSEESLERKRNTLFGGARPRELVLKERGVDDNSLDPSHSPNRVSSPRNEARPDHLAPTAPSAARHTRRTDNYTLDKRIMRDSERKDQRTDHEAVDVQKKNWRSSKDSEKKHQQDPQPEPVTWRKPIEEPDQAAPDTSGPKVASALELAQAFSRLNSDPKISDRYSGQDGHPGPKIQIPFSRLTDTRQIQSPAPTTRRHVSGY